VFFVFYAGFNHGQFSSSDETGVYAVTESLYERHSLVVPVHIHAHVGEGNKLYSPFAIGQSVLALPLYALAKPARQWLPKTWAVALAGRHNEHRMSLPKVDRVRLAAALPPGVPAIARTLFGGTLETFFVGLVAPILSGCLAMAVFILVRQLEISPRSALLTTVLICVCSYPAMMSIYFLRHTVETILLLFAFGQLRHFRMAGNIGALALGSTFASAIFLVRFPGVLAGPAIGLYMAMILYEHHRFEDRSWPRDLLAVGVPFGVSVALHMIGNSLRWGTWITSPMTEAGFETSTSFGTSLVAFLMSPGIGIFAYSPLLLLSPWTFHAAWSRWPKECLVVGLFCMTQLLYFSNYRFWTGLYSAPGPRYLFPACVLMLIAFGGWLDSRPGKRAQIAIASLAAIGATVQFILLHVSWSAVVNRENYVTADPPFSFLYKTESSPIIASARAFADGQIDTWLWKLAIGWPGHEAAPLVAAGLVLLWVAGSVAGAVLLWRRVTRHGLELLAAGD
jgi:hypothetical protein